MSITIIDAGTMHAHNFMRLDCLGSPGKIICVALLPWQGQKLCELRLRARVMGNGHAHAPISRRMLSEGT